MASSQNVDYKLQEKLNEISTLEFMELERTEDIFVNLGYGSPSEYNDNYQQFKNKVVEIRAKYNKQRKRAIWWAMYGVDVVVFSVVVLLLVWGIWQFFF